jgi:hypothetical protein
MLHQAGTLAWMFCVSESDVAAIHAAFQADGEFAAAVELRRRFVGISSNAEASRSVQVILRWTAPTQPLSKPDGRLERRPKALRSSCPAA